MGYSRSKDVSVFSFNDTWSLKRYYVFLPPVLIPEFLEVWVRWLSMSVKVGLDGAIVKSTDTLGDVITF